MARLFSAVVGGGGASVFLRGLSPPLLGVFRMSGVRGEEFDLVGVLSLRLADAAFDGGVGGLKLGGFSSNPDIRPSDINFLSMLSSSSPSSSGVSKS